MKSDESRPYRMSARAHAVQETRERILQAMVDLWLEHHYDDITLEEVALRAGVSRQTVFRQFGGKDELLTAAAQWAAPRMDEVREVTAGDIDEAIHKAVAGYEIMGEANVRALEIEGRVEAIDAMLERGRTAHRAWLEEVFAHDLPESGDDREHAVLALYAATDVGVWKLLRRDFGMPIEDTEAVIRTLVRGVIDATARKEHP